MSTPASPSNSSLPGLPGTSAAHPHRLQAKVYLEDTDAQGIVYHANYLKYCERSRTEILGQYGYTLGEMQARGTLFVVFEMKLRFLKSARLHDELEVVTVCERTSDYRVVFQHKVHKRGPEGLHSEPLFVADAQVVAIDPEGELLELPEGLFA
jgi:acyl-CoA thioester hydrolase